MEINYNFERYIIYPILTVVEFNDATFFELQKNKIFKGYIFPCKSLIPSDIMSSWGQLEERDVKYFKELTKYCVSVLLKSINIDSDETNINAKYLENKFGVNSAFLIYNKEKWSSFQIDEYHAFFGSIGFSLNLNFPYKTEINRSFNKFEKDYFLSKISNTTKLFINEQNIPRIRLLDCTD